MKNNNKVLFSNIIGYNDIKKTLGTIIDVLNNQEKYKKLGSNIPHGLLLYGPPGTGKSSFANEILDNTINRKRYIIRKNRSDGKFIDHINKVFNDAIKNQPSIILLDDLDKFAEDEDRKNQEEFVTVQSLIDDIKNENIFVIATVNSYYSLPTSLKRAGRFDVQLKIDTPNEKDAYKIFEYYIKNKKISKDVDIKKISCILTNSSCAELEKVCNQAGIYAGYKNKKSIGMEELLRSALELKYKTNIEDYSVEDKYAINTAYHEAGHALIGELLEPGSISFITIAKSDSETKGMTIFHENEDYFQDISFMQNRVKSLLAGKAATEIVFNKCDVGSNSDIKRAYDIAKRFVDDYCMIDFNSWINIYEETPEIVKESKSNNTIKVLSDYYNEVKLKLVQNKELLDKLANILKEKKILFQDEIREIIKE